ncbi:MAG: hypothetical protein ACW98Y_19430 [Candidatus Thorarchaeota archaeon]
MANEERFPLKRYRQVSELRIQFLCEHRLLLRNRHSDQPTEWSRRGSELHNKVANNQTRTSPRISYFKIGIILMTVIAGLLWILG